MSFLFDLIIIGLLAFFAWRGATKGLILSLCGLAAVFVAFFAAQFVADTFSPPVANIIRPVITQSFQKVAPHPAVIEDEEDEDEEDEEDPGPGYTLEELFASVEENGLFEGFSTFLKEGVEQDAVEEEDWSTPAEALASYLAGGIAHALLFAVVFLAIQLAWFLVSHALDLAFKLPLLSEVNLVGGLLVGLLKGALLIVVLVWLGQLFGLVPAQPDTPVLSLFTVDRLWELLGALPQ